MTNGISFLTETIYHTQIKSLILAFAYNFSLSVSLIPLAYYLKKNFSYKPLKKSKLIIYFFAIIFIFNTFGILQFLFNSYLLPNAVIQNILKHGIIRLDQINGLYRAFSLFKSPFEFAIFNIYFSLLALAYSLHKKNFLSFLSFFICSFAVICTISRTSILILLVGIIMVFALHNRQNYKENKTNYKKLFYILPPLLIGIYFATNFLSHYFYFFETVLSFNNLENRLYEWTNTLVHFCKNKSNLLLGLGTVQNGKYGDYHMLIIDNTYLGVILSGGLSSLLLFFTFNFLYIKKVFTNLKLNSYLIAEAAFLIAFFTGAIFENLMHCWYLITLPVFF